MNVTWKIMNKMPSKVLKLVGKVLLEKGEND